MLRLKHLRTFGSEVFVVQNENGLEVFFYQVKIDLFGILLLLPDL